MLYSVLFFVILLLANIVSGIVGFGSNIIAMPFLTLFVDARVVVPVLVVMSLLNCGPRAVYYHKDINKKVFLAMLPCALIGGILGVLLVSNMEPRFFKLTLACLMIFMGVKGILEHLGKWALRKKDKIQPWMLVFPLAGGVLQGAFATGGPLYNIFILLNTDRKNEIRITQYAIASLTSILVFFGYWQSGMYTGLTLHYLLIAIPSALLAMVISEKVFHKINDRQFKLCVALMLLIAGAVMGVQNLF